MTTLLLALLVLGAPPRTVPDAGTVRRVTDDNGCNKGIDGDNELHGEIVCTRGGVKTYEGLYEHGKRVGVAKTWRDTGKLGSVVTFVDGKRNGLGEEYDLDGNLSESCTWKDDQKHGPCKLYARGKLYEERMMENGSQRGPFTGYSQQTGKVIEKGFLDENGRPHGLQERFRHDGSKDTERPMVHGELEGVEREWHPNGKLKREITWKAGKQHGLMRDYWESGQLQSERCYQNGNSVEGTNACTGKSGVEVVKEFSADGKVRRSTTVKDGKSNGEAQEFDRDGRLVRSTQYADGRRDGLEKLFKDGKLERQTTYKAGRRDGPETVFFPDGKPSEENVWKDDRKESFTLWWMNGKKKHAETPAGELVKRQRWHDTGQLELEETFRRGGYSDLREGPSKRWSESGTLLEELTFQKGKQHGVQKRFFDKSGKPLDEETWEQGMRTSRREWDENGTLLRDEQFNPDGSRK